MNVKQAKNSMGEDRADNEALLEPLTFSAFNDATPGSSALHNDMATVEVGMRFAVDRSGSVTELKYWRGSGDANDTDVREGYLWRADGTLLATVAFTSDPGQTGWQVATLSSPVPLTAGVEYIVSYRTDDNYVSTPNYFVDANDVAFDGLNNDSFWGQDGVVRVVQDGAGGTNGVFRYGSGPAVMPSESLNSANYWVDITFDTGIAPSNSGPDITSAAALTSRENRRTVGAITAIDANGDPLSYTITGGADAALFTIDAQTGVLSFTNTPNFEAPADTGANNVYDLTVSVSDGIAPAVTQAITVAVTDRDENDTSSSVFDSTDAPAATKTTDPIDYELGTRFTANAAGTITELRYFRGAADANDTDTRVLTLWDAAGTRLGSVTVTSAAGESGWQVGILAAPIAIQAGATYVVSYGTTQNYAYTENYFTTALTGPDGVLSTGVDSGVFAVAPGAFPTETYHSLNYWVDVNFVRNTAPVGIDDADATLVEGGIGGAGTASASGNVLANDIDADVPLGDVLAVTGVRVGTEAAAGALTGVSGSTVIAGTYGSLTIGANGAWSYALDNLDRDTQSLLAGQQATETFTYAVMDGQGQSDTAQLVLTITGDADPLIAVADKIYVTRGAVTIPAAVLLANDSGDGTLTIQSIVNATGGTVAVDGSGNPVFAPSTVASVTTGDFDYTVGNGWETTGAHVTLGFVTSSDRNSAVTIATLANEFSFIDGMAGIDHLTGGAGRDTFYGGAGNDTLAGGAGSDTLHGGVDNDKLDGNAGADVMYGGSGNDTYFVDNAGDVVREDTVAGVDDGGVLDIVKASISYTLGAFIERLVMTGSAAIDGIGNGLANVITGNNGANHLYGMGGNDILIANGNGADVLDGGEGNDTYNVDNSDIVHDTGTTGADTVISNGGYTLAAGSGIENLMIRAGTTNVATLTGDDLANRLTGNDGDNTLRGLGGNDILQGGLGNDKLQGGPGRDTLDGGDGSDIFIFNAGDSPATVLPLAFDTLNDFQTGFDRIDLDFIKGSGLVASAYAEVAIGSNGFPAVLNAATAAMADGQHSVVFVAGSTDGWLLWNTDSNPNTPDQAVRLVGQNSLAAFDRTDLM